VGAGNQTTVEDG